MQPYFTRFPQFVYSNTVCVDITKRVALTGDGRQSPYQFYPYTITNELRSDHVAEYYYDDAELDWLVLIANAVIDPYYDWYLGQDKFNSLIVQKYGSIEKSQKKIKFYRNNWYADYNQISPSMYENTIDKNWKKYYTPVLAPNFRIVSYKRKEVDTTMNTNRVYQYAVTYNNANTFSIGELVDIKIPTFDETVGVGEVVLANSTVLRIQSVSGNTTANSSFQKQIYGEDGGASVNAVSRETIYENIPESEEVFWSPVYMYEYEEEFNEQRKNILLIGDGVQSFFVNDFTKKIQSDG